MAVNLPSRPARHWHSERGLSRQGCAPASRTKSSDAPNPRLPCGILVGLDPIALGMEFLYRSAMSHAFAPLLAEPTRTFLAASLIGRRRPRASLARRDWLRVSQRLASGLTPKEVARAEATDEAAIQKLLEDASFRELVDGEKALMALPEEEQRARLVRLARTALENALCDDHAGAALFVLSEEARGRDPALTLARGILARGRTRAPAPAAAPSPPRPPAPPRPYDPLGALTRRGAAELRRVVVEEHAARHAATAPAGAAATRAGAAKALALRKDAAATGGLVTPAAPPAPRPKARPAVPAERPAAPIASLPRRPRAP